MPKKVTKVALIYDFDGTLSTTDMQDYALIPELGMEPKDFWPVANKWSRDNGADQVIGSMYYFVKTANEKGVKLTRSMLKDAGKNIVYFAGVEEWFNRISAYGKELNLKIEHYIISAGYEEILEGSKIYKYFKNVFGCSFAYGDDGTPVWPARVVNYSTKTQYLSKINKGLGKLEDRLVNEFMPDEETASVKGVLKITEEGFVTNYIENDAFSFDTTDTKIQLLAKDPEKEDVVNIPELPASSYGFKVNGDGEIIDDPSTITVTNEITSVSVVSKEYPTLTVDIPIRVFAPEVCSMKVVKKDYTTTYFVGEPFNFDKQATQIMLYASETNCANWS